MPKRTSRSDGDTKPSEKPATEARKQVTVYLPPQQWRALKVHAAQHDLEMSEIVSDALTKAGIK